MMFHGLQAEKDNPIIDGQFWQQRALAAESKLESYQMLALYAKDVLDFWPNMSFKTIRIMIPKMAALEEALKLVK